MAVSPGFINRTEEIAQITSLVDTLVRPFPKQVDAYLPTCVVNFYGPPGIGKSKLLGELRVRLGARSLALLIDLRTPHLLQGLLQEKLYFVKAAVYALEKLPESPDLLALHDQLAAIESLASTAPDEANGRVDEALAGYLDVLRGLSEQRVILLLIDSCEHASEALFAWLERYFLLPLIQDAGGRPSRAIGVFASQMLLRWRQHNVRRRVEPYPVAPLSVEATIEQAGDHALGSEIYGLTFGHALSNSVAIRYLKGHTDDPAHQLRWLAQHRQELIAEVVRQLHDHALTSMLVAEGAPSAGWERWDLWEMMEPLALLREFDVNSMRVILEQAQVASGPSQSNLLIAIREMLKTRLVEWNGTRRAYQITPAIRQIFARSFALRQPELYAELRAGAVAYYADQIRSVPANRNLYLAEYAFQVLSAPQITPDRVEQLGTQFAAFLAEYYANESRTYFDSESLAALERTLDADAELQQALQRQNRAPNMLARIVRDFQRDPGAS